MYPLLSIFNICELKAALRFTAEELVSAIEYRAYRELNIDTGVIGKIFTQKDIASTSAFSSILTMLNTNARQQHTWCCRLFYINDKLFVFWFDDFTPVAERKMNAYIQTLNQKSLQT
jgi:hypothetical protein